MYVNRKMISFIRYLCREINAYILQFNWNLIAISRVRALFSTKLKYTSSPLVRGSRYYPSPSRPYAAHLNCQRRVKIIGIWQRVIRDTLDDGGTTR